MVLLFQSLNETASSVSTTLVFVYFTSVFYSGYLMVRAFQRARLVQSIARWLLFAAYALLTWFGMQILLPVGPPAAFDPFTTSLRGLGEITQLVPARYWLILIALWLILRGASAARKGVGTFAIQRHFRLGVVMFLVYSFLAFATVGDLPGLGVFTIFLFATLLSMAAARVSILGRLRGGRRNPFSRSWFGSMTGAVAATIGVGLTAAMLATGRFLLFYRQLLLGFFFTVVTITLAPFLLILGLFANTPVEDMPAAPPTQELPPWEDDPGFLLDFGQRTTDQVDIIPPEYRIYFYWGLSAVGVMIVIGLFFGVQMLTRRRDTVEKTEYVIKSGDLLERLRKEFEKRRKAFQDSLTGANPLARGQQILAAARIRRIYAALIELAKTFGAGRDPAQTPLEYMDSLKSSLPAASGPIQAVTHAYLKIRYGELPEHSEEVQAVEKAWTQIQQAAIPAVKRYELKQKEEARERKRMEQVR